MDIETAITHALRGIEVSAGTRLSERAHESVPSRGETVGVTLVARRGASWRGTSAMKIEKVAYNSEAAKYAVAFRQEARRVGIPVAGKNLCTVGFWGPSTGNAQFTFVSEPPGTKDVPTAHSEMVGLRALKWELDRGGRITWLYTERQPCGSASGHANCTSKLDGALETYGANGRDTPVYFSFDYPTAADLESLISDGLLSLDEAREMAREECQCTTAFIIGMDKTIGETVPEWRA